jgi:ABC-type glycerol-3-phosphate transport system permease component
MANTSTALPLRAKPDQVLKHSILVLATIVALAPTAFMILTSLKSQEEYTFNKVGWPQAIVLDHFHSVLFESDFIGWMGNSIILAGGAVALSTIVSCLGAYAIARMQFVGRGLLFSVGTSLMAIPPVVMIVPLFGFIPAAADQYVRRCDPYLCGPHHALLGLSADQFLPHLAARAF